MNTKVNFTYQPDEESQMKCCDYQFCAKCKGTCCQTSGCVLAPSDIYVLKHKFTKEQRIRYLKMRLMHGDLSIDHKCLRDAEMGAYLITGNIFNRDNISVDRNKLLAGKGVLVLRARNRGKKIVDIIHYNWEPDGPCASWSKESGCKFPFHKRPKGGRMLLPDPLRLSNTYCIPNYNELTAALEWLEFQDILYEVFVHFKRLKM